MARGIPEKMKAVVLHDWNDLRYEDVEIPQYGPDEVLCQVSACGICATDVHIARGELEGIYPPHLPFIMGHEWYGEVVALGSEVEGFSAGQRVIGEPQKGCGVCPQCMTGRYHLCRSAPSAEKGYKLYGHNVNGAYAEYIAAVATTLHPMPDNLGLEEGVSACNVGIGTEAVRRGRIDLGDDVVVIGVGLLGLIVLQLAKVSGAGRTIAVGRGHRLKMAGEMGADEKVDRTQGNVVEKVRELTNGEGADVVFECAGAEESVRQSLECVKRGGRLTLVGVCGKKGIPLDTDRIVLDEIEVIGSRGAPNALHDSITLLTSGRISVKPLVTHKLPLADAQRGMEIFTKRLENAIRVALIP
jgi:threonine dehydrogenase-like Zn-dependent dehydrogenase